MLLAAVLGLIIIGMNYINDKETDNKLQREANLYHCEIIDSRTGKVYNPM